MSFRWKMECLTTLMSFSEQSLSMECLLFHERLFSKARSSLEIFCVRVKAFQGLEKKPIVTLTFYQQTLIKLHLRLKVLPTFVTFCHIIVMICVTTKFKWTIFNLLYIRNSNTQVSPQIYETNSAILLWSTRWMRNICRWVISRLTGVFSPPIRYHMLESQACINFTKLNLYQ